MILFDTHAHLDDRRFDGDREGVLARAAAAGLVGLINPAYDRASCRRAVALAERYGTAQEGRPPVWALVGIQPNAPQDAEGDWLELLADLARHPRVVGIGEIGLDYHWMKAPPERQMEIFRAQIDLARQLDLPIVIHSRDAHGDTRRILLREAKGLTVILHSFSGDESLAREYVAAGFFLSLSGPITYKNGANLRRVAAAVPLEHLLVETDSPYLTPAPHRGRRNEPAYVRYVAEAIARVRGEDPERVAEATTANARRAFRVD